MSRKPNPVPVEDYIDPKTVKDDAAQMKDVADKLLPVLKAYKKEENPAS